MYSDKDYFTGTILTIIIGIICYFAWQIFDSAGLRIEFKTQMVFVFLLSIACIPITFMKAVNAFAAKRMFRGLFWSIAVAVFMFSQIITTLSYMKGDFIWM